MKRAIPLDRNAAGKGIPMSHDLAGRVATVTAETAATPAVAPLLDRTLDWQFDWACRTVAEPAHGRPRIEVVVDAGERDSDEVWRAANARAAELCWQHRVEILLVQEGSELRIAVERHGTAGQGVTRAGEGRAPASSASPRFLARLRALLGR